jgi:uncharacterized membrane protein
MHFEPRSQPPIPRSQFYKRLAHHGRYALVLVLFSLGIGMAGYHWLGERSWVDSFLNASMIMSGMGPVGDFPNDRSKIFAGLYALYSGLVFLVVAVLLMTPVFHRLMHKFHWEDPKDGKM